MLLYVCTEGNKATLDISSNETGRSIHDTLLSYYDKFYSANMMKFVLYGKESLETLQSWAEAKLGGVVNKNLSRFQVESDPFPASSLPRFITLVPIKESKTLQIHFALPEVESKWRSKPTRYITHLLGTNIAQHNRIE
jgi:insulysin